MCETLFEGYPPAWRITKSLTSPLNPYYPLIDTTLHTHILEEPVLWRGRTYSHFNRIDIGNGDAFFQFSDDANEQRLLGRDPLFVNFVFLGHRLGLTVRELVHMANLLCRKSFPHLEPIYHGPTTWAYVDLPEGKDSFWDWLESMDEAEYQQCFFETVRSTFDNLARYAIALPVRSLLDLAQAWSLYKYLLKLEPWTQAELIVLYNPEAP